jgi:hypothetical protein
MLAVFVPVVGAWFLWKLRFYGDLLPNTYYVKANPLSIDVLLRGASYLAMFALHFLYVVIVPALLAKRFVALREWRGQPVGVRQGVGMAAAICALWWLYVVKSGGDFMEFRFLVPTIPLLLIGVGFLLHGASPRQRRGFVALLLFGNFFQFFATEYLATRWGLYRKGFSSVDTLDVRFPDRWHRIGRRLGEVFEHDRGVVIAVNPVGVITYQSDLTCVDLFGLNDRWVARHGTYDPTAAPGHRRQATLDYVLERDVNLLIGHPQEFAPGQAGRIRFDAESLGSHFLPVPNALVSRLSATSVLEIPIDAEQVLLAWYRTPSPQVERAIARFGLRRHPVALGVARQAAPANTADSERRARGTDRHDAAGSRPVQRARRFAEGAAGGDDVVDEPDAGRNARAGDEGAAHVAPPRAAIEARLAGRVAHAPQRDGIEAYAALAGQRARQHTRGVEAARTQPPRVERHRHHQVGGLRRRPRAGLEAQHARHREGRGIEGREPGRWVLEAMNPGFDDAAKFDRRDAGREGRRSRRI